jgi:hypothetical protein
LANYKALARGLSKNSRETLERRRYEVRDDGRPCRVVAQDAPGRTRCHAPTDHSPRRKTCTLLVDPDAPFAPTFPPGLHLYGHPSFQGEDFVCKYHDIIMNVTEDVDTRTQRPAPYSVAVFGPFVDPLTRKLVVRCISTNSFHPSNIRGSLVNLGHAFLHLNARGEPDNITCVPTFAMMDAFVRQLVDVEKINIANTIADACVEGKRIEQRCQRLADRCAEDATRLRKVRLLMRCFYETSLYSRRWAGPECKPPVETLPPPVDHAGNPLSQKLKNKFASASVQGAKVVADGNAPADFVDGPGMLPGMHQAWGQSALALYDSLDAITQATLRSACALGYSFYKIDGSGYWMSYDEVNNIAPGRNGNRPVNGEPFQLNLFTMYFGMPDTNHPRGLYAQSSVQGTNTYCLQIASSMTGRTVLTLLPYLYKTRPTWAAAEGPWHTLHT